MRRKTFAFRRKRPEKDGVRSKVMDTNKKTGRQHFGSRLGFILLSAGCAIGLGNVWRFPMIVGENGGGSFVLIYLICLLLIGLPVMTMEFSLGRAAQTSPVRMYEKLTPDKPGWRLHGYLSLAANIVLMMFYTTIAGWILKYCVYSVTGTLAGKNPEQVEDVFHQMTANPEMMLLYVAIIAGVAAFVCSLSLNGGLEKITKFMMLALLVMLIGMAVFACTLDGAGKGLSFYLKPDFGKITFGVVGNAMIQALFTLSLGIGSMAIFGSYIGKERSLLGESCNVILLDTLVAIVAGIIIFPACFTFGTTPDQGPGLLFVTLPNVFNQMSGGRIVGCLFFIFMLAAALSTVIAVYENIIASLCELTGMSRKKTAFLAWIGLTLLNIPVILGFNRWSGFHPFGMANKDISDLEDFFVSYLMLPIGSLAYVLYCISSRFGWGFDRFLEEANQGTGWKVKKWMRKYCTYVLPLILLFVFVISLLSFFEVLQ